MNELARLLVPALRWDRAHGFRYLDGLVDDALELGVGGFLVEGGPRDEVAALIGRLHAESRHPILVAGRAERGAGGTFDGLTELPSFGAIASVAVVQPEGSTGPALDAAVVRRAALLTIRELKNVGVNWALAPVCDLDVALGNSDVGARGASGDPAVIGAVVAEWIDTCQADAVLACAMHFPGIGRAGAGGPSAVRPHDGLAPVPSLRVLKDAVSQLRANDFHPFTTAIDAGVASVMIAPVSVPAFGAPEGAMTSAAMIENVLRTEMHFDGIVSTVPFDREPTMAPTSEASVAIAALVAGCDIVLAPGDLSGVADALARAAGRREVSAPRLRQAIERVERWAGWARPAAAAREPSMDDVLWSRQLADSSLRFARGRRPRIGGTIEVVLVGHAGSASFEGSGDSSVAGPFTATLRAMHIEVTESAAPSPKERAPLAIVFVPESNATGGAGTAAADERPSHETIAAIVDMCAAAIPGAEPGRDVVVIACCHPRAAAAIAGALPGDAALVCAWDSARPMLEAAARALVSPTLR